WRTLRDGVADHLDTGVAEHLFVNCREFAGLSLAHIVLLSQRGFDDGGQCVQDADADHHRRRVPGELPPIGAGGQAVRETTLPALLFEGGADAASCVCMSIELWMLRVATLQRLPFGQLLPVDIGLVPARLAVAIMAVVRRQFGCTPYGRTLSSI